MLVKTQNVNISVQRVKGMVIGRSKWLIGNRALSTIRPVIGLCDLLLFGGGREGYPPTSGRVSSTVTQTRYAGWVYGNCPRNITAVYGHFMFAQTVVLPLVRPFVNQTNGQMGQYKLGWWRRTTSFYPGLSLTPGRQPSWNTPWLALPTCSPFLHTDRLSRTQSTGADPMQIQATTLFKRPRVDIAPSHLGPTSITLCAKCWAASQAAGFWRICLHHR